jgi:hypothetical protein
MIASSQNRVEQVAQEDLVMFINACLACTGQKEFYGDAYGQRVSIDFLHDYILGNYRLLYARSLAAGINHFNQAQIIFKLLATGKQTPREHKSEEGALIATALQNLPPQRAWGVLEQLRKQGINNRRSRAIARDYLTQRRDLSFDAVKYRAKVRAIASHAHLNLPEELGTFLFAFNEPKSYTTPLFEQFRQAHYSAEAVYELPFTIAEGLAGKHKIPREIFLSRIQERMTLTEKLRFQGAAERTEVEINLNLGRLPLTKLALYILSLPLETREKEWNTLNQALEKSARLALKKAPLKIGRVAAVLDCSYSSYGSNEKRRRPLAVAVATHYLLKAAAKDYRAFWTTSIKDPLFARPCGQTDLATPLLAALGSGVESVVIISDGCDNDPPNGAAEVLRIFRSKLDRFRKTSIVHCNPVFNSDDFSLRPLSQSIPTVGLRDAEDLPTMLKFARFADGSAHLAELETYLAERVALILGNY